MGLAIPKRGIETIQEHQLGMVARTSQRLTRMDAKPDLGHGPHGEVFQMQID